MPKTHKRTKRKGVVGARCGDKRATKFHNWWGKTDCNSCWMTRAPEEGDRCEMAPKNCKRSAKRWLMIRMEGTTDYTPRATCDDCEPKTAREEEALVLRVRRVGGVL